MKREDCEHKTVFFGSGDYYIFCQHCDARWGTISTGRSEYGYDKLGNPIGCDSSVANQGVGGHLSGQTRIAE